MASITQKGYAKINLGLDVLRRREDGYHELRMIMQTVDIYDELLIEKTDENGMVTLTANCEGLPLDENNLIVKAARIMMDTYHLSGGLRIHLTKQIPMAAGMAGGSADAAATFLGINRLFGLNLTKEELEKHGVRVGADVPYCILGGTCLAEGIGEILTPIRQLPDVPVVIVKPDFDVSTGYVYGNLHADTLKNHPDIRSLGIFIGPEGGIDPEEISFLSSLSCDIITLGPRILRTETAGLAAVSAFSALYGEME